MSKDDILDDIKKEISKHAEIAVKGFDNMPGYTTNQEVKSSGRLGHARIEVYIRVYTN